MLSINNDVDFNQSKLLGILLGILVYPSKFRTCLIFIRMPEQIGVFISGGVQSRPAQYYFKLRTSSLQLVLQTFLYTEWSIAPFGTNQHHEGLLTID